MISGGVCLLNQNLLGVLAIQRFFLYFFPSTEKYLNFSKATLNWIIWLNILIPWFVIFVVAAVHLRYETSLDFMESSTAEIPLLVQNIFLLISAILYVPIIISLRKYKYLMSVQLNRPQRYVFWQLVVIVIEKCINYLLVYLTSASFNLEEMHICSRLFYKPLTLVATNGTWILYWVLWEMVQWKLYVGQYVEGLIRSSRKPWKW